MDSDAASGPPRLPFVLSVGVTGHRAEALPADGLATLRERIGAILGLITDAAQSLFESERATFADGPPVLRFVTPIADGADQIAAEVALEQGWELQAVLPFARDYYRSTLANDEARERFDALLGRASRVLELPGEQGQEPEGYAMVGRATVAHCDILIAVWDGLKARGRGGTGEVVELAVLRGVPVVHIAPEPDRPARILWAAFDPVVDTMGDDPMAERAADREHVEIMLRGMLIPPPDPQEQQFLAHFMRERLPHFRLRIEYSLLLTLAGVRRIKTRDLTEKQSLHWIREEWQQYRAAYRAHNVAAPLDLLEETYKWSDLLATNLAHTYRSGHIFSFVFGGIAVCMGLSAFMAPHLIYEFAVAEMVITIAIILNAYIGTKKEWHRRWLDYRQLAERLRPMRSLKFLGIAAPDPPGTETSTRRPRRSRCRRPRRRRPEPRTTAPAGWSRTGGRSSPPAPTPGSPRPVPQTASCCRSARRPARPHRPRRRRPRRGRAPSVRRATAARARAGPPGAPRRRRRPASPRPSGVRTASTMTASLMVPPRCRTGCRTRK